jgi:hypothetical protein
MVVSLPTCFRWAKAINKKEEERKQNNKMYFIYSAQCTKAIRSKSISSGGLHMDLYSKIWRFGAKIHLQQGL